MTDTERLDFLSKPDVEIGRRACDAVRSDLCAERAVRFYVHGLHRTVNGDTLREAIDKAIDVYSRAYEPDMLLTMLPKF